MSFIILVYMSTVRKLIHDDPSVLIDSSKKFLRKKDQVHQQDSRDSSTAVASTAAVPKQRKKTDEHSSYHITEVIYSVPVSYSCNHQSQS